MARAWRPEPRVEGPRVVRLEDVPQLNKLFAESFTDRYRKDGLVGVRVPHLNPKIWEYAIRDAGEGAMLWLDHRDRLAAFNVAHHSGAEGWMGPLAVRPDLQAGGLGKVIVRAAIDWLKDQGVRTIGLETMPRTVDNIGFYSKLGFEPRALTITLSGDIGSSPVDSDWLVVSSLSGADRESLLESCRERIHQAAPGYDFTREVILTVELGLGDAALVKSGSEIKGMVLWHSEPLAESRQDPELRVLKLFADSDGIFETLIRGVENVAARCGMGRVALRCQTGFLRSYRQLLGRGYRVRWTDLRMTLRDFPEVEITGDEILFSNWEI